MKYQIRPFWAPNHASGGYLGGATPFVIEAESQSQAEEMAWQVLQTKDDRYPNRPQDYKNLKTFVVPFRLDRCRIGGPTGPIEEVKVWVNGWRGNTPGVEEWPPGSYNL